MTRIIECPDGNEDLVQFVIVEKPGEASKVLILEIGDIEPQDVKMWWMNWYVIPRTSAVILQESGYLTGQDCAQCPPYEVAGYDDDTCENEIESHGPYSKLQDAFDQAQKLKAQAEVIVIEVVGGTYDTINLWNREQDGEGE